MGIAYTNNAEALLNANINDTVTTFVLQAGGGAYFPPVVAASGDYFYVTMVNTAGAIEIIKVTEHVSDSDTFATVERAADGLRDQIAVALAWTAGDKVQARLCAKGMEDILTLDDSEKITFGAGPDAQMYSNGTDLVIMNGAGTETMLKATQNGAVSLYYDDDVTLETTTSGIKIYDGTTADGASLYFLSDDFGIRNNDAGGWIWAQARTAADDADNYVWAADPDGAISLYYDGNVKLATTNTGATLTGVLISDGLTVGDDEYLKFGAGPDGWIFSNGTSLFITNGNGSENMAIFAPNGAVSLYHNNSAKFATSATGITVTGNLTASGGVVTGTDEGVVFGANAGYIIGNSTTLEVRDDVGSLQMTVAKNGAVTLNFATVAKFATVSDGSEITGALRLTEITTPTATASRGKVYTKTDNKLYFQDGAGTEHEIAFV